MDGVEFGSGAGVKLTAHNDAIGIGAVNGGTCIQTVGIATGSGTRALAGSIGDVKVFNQALDVGAIASLAGVAEPLTINLANDTGNSESDGITADPTITGNVGNAAGLTKLEAQLNDSGDYFDILPLVQADGSYTLTLEDLGVLNAGSLTYGDYFVDIRAEDTTGQLSETTVDFTYELQIPNAPYTQNRFLPLDLDPASDFSFTYDFSEFLATADDDEQLMLYVYDGTDSGQTLLDNGPNGSPLLTVTTDYEAYPSDLVDIVGQTATIDLSSLTDEELATAILYEEIITPQPNWTGNFGSYTTPSGGGGGGAGGGGYRFSFSTGAALDGGSSGGGGTSGSSDPGTGGGAPSPGNFTDPASVVFLTEIATDDLTVNYEKPENAGYSRPKQIAFEGNTLDLSYDASGNFSGSSDPELLDVVLASVGLDDISALDQDEAKAKSFGAFQLFDTWERVDEIALKPNKDIGTLSQTEKTKLLKLEKNILEMTTSLTNFEGYREDYLLLSEIVKFGTVYASAPYIQEFGGIPDNLTSQSLYDGSFDQDFIDELRRLNEQSPSYPERSLTQEQIAIAQKVFGSSIDYSQVRYTVGYLGPINQTAVVLGNTIHFSEQLYDQEILGDSTPEYLIHELVHVWQYQNGGWQYAFDSAVAQIQALITAFDRNLAYEWEESFDAGLAWRKWSAEHQAQLVQDYYDIATRGNDTDPNNDRPFDPDQAEMMADLQSFQPYIEQIRLGQGAPDYQDFLGLYNFDALYELFR